MSRKRLLQLIAGLTLVTSFVVGCGAPAATPEATATSTPVPPTPTPEATATPTSVPPTSTPPPPSPAPHGERIAFNSERDGNFEVYAVNADG